MFTNEVTRFAVAVYLICLRGLSYKNQPPRIVVVEQQSRTLTFFFSLRECTRQTLDKAAAGKMKRTCRSAPLWPPQTWPAAYWPQVTWGQWKTLRGCFWVLPLFPQVDPGSLVTTGTAQTGVTAQVIWRHWPHLT